MAEAPTSESVSTRLRRIAELARTARDRRFTNLAHHIDVELLHEAYRRTRKDGAPGVDEQTADEYASNLEANLRTLHERAKTGSYRAPPVKRAHIPKGNGETRPIGIPTFEDKILQRAVAMVLESVYEQDFFMDSYGFRPGRSAHQALDRIWKFLMGMGGGWVLEVDIRKFFDTLDHGYLREILDQRIGDQGLQRLIGKWLNAGVMEGNDLTYPTMGTPQGGVISPLLANVYLHTVLDQWFQNEVQPRLQREAYLIRYADDFVILFRNETDAHRVLEVLPKRFARYGLTIHPTKTRLLEFRPPDKGGSAPKPATDKGSFDFLGFTHFWARSRKGKDVVKCKTAKSRLARSLKAVGAWLARWRHNPIPWQYEKLKAKLRGHCQYYGITGNSEALTKFRQGMISLWRYWLARRSQRAKWTWKRFVEAVVKRYPLRALAVHSRYQRLANA